MVAASCYGHAFLPRQGNCSETKGRLRRTRSPLIPVGPKNSTRGTTKDIHVSRSKFNWESEARRKIRLTNVFPSTLTEVKKMGKMFQFLNVSSWWRYTAIDLQLQLKQKKGRGWVHATLSRHNIAMMCLRSCLAQSSTERKFWRDLENFKGVGILLRYTQPTHRQVSKWGN